MGLLSRIKDKVKEKVAGVPNARPADGTHQDRDAAAAAAKKAGEGTHAKKNAGDDKPWYLDGQNDGWDETNPNADKKS
jgi:hypothetical protein